MHGSPKAMIVVDRIVLSTSIVPERNRILLPSETAGELRFDLVFEEVLQQRCTFLIGPTLKALGMSNIDI